MPKAKKTTLKQFNQLSEQQQVRELKNLAKRANVRAALLEESGIINDAYRSAQYFNEMKGREKNRFYEGVKYGSQQEIKQAYTALSNFLNNKSSTLSGIRTELEQKVDKLIEKGQFDTNTLGKLTTKEKTYISKEAAKIANKKLKDLEKAGIDTYAYAIAGHYNKETGRKNNSFYRGSKFKDEKDLNIHIQNIFDFLNAKTSTPRGYVEVIKDRLDAFRAKGIKIANGDEQKFLDFISSEQFKALGKYADSNQVIETFVEARNANIDVEEINKEFTNYMNGELTFDEVQEKLHAAKWQQGGLLK